MYGVKQWKGVVSRQNSTAVTYSKIDGILSIALQMVQLWICLRQCINYSKYTVLVLWLTEIPNPT